MLKAITAALLMASAPPGGVDVKTVECAAQTDPVATADDAADDPAVWVHPTDPGQSLVIGTNKKAGLVVYELSGKTVQVLDDGRMNNVDVVQTRDRSVVMATNRSDNTVAVYGVDARTRRLDKIPEATIRTGLDEVYGFAAALDPKTEAILAVVGSKRGLVRVYELKESGGAWNHRVVREFWVGGQVEGMVVDAELGWLYVGEEQVGVWRYSLDPEAKPGRRVVDAVRQQTGAGGKLAPDVEGVTVYDAGGGSGWVIVSCQGEDRYAVYDRRTLEYRGSFGLKLGADRVTHTDGIHASSRAMGAKFPRGVFVAQDDNDGAQQNFKVVDWRAIEVALGL